MSSGFGEKEKTLKELSEFINEGKVDQGVLPVLELLNSHNDYYTTSSCAGRVQLIQMEHIGDKKNSRVLGKWHDGTDLDTLTETLDSWDGSGYIYLMSQSPIFHVRCRDLESAARLQVTGRLIEDDPVIDMLFYQQETAILFA